MILAFCYNIGLCGNWFLKSAIYPFIHHYQGSAINKALSQAWWETKIDAKDTLLLWRAWTKGTGWLPRIAPPTQFSNSVNHGDIWSERNVVCWLWHGWLYYLLFNGNTLRGKGRTVHHYIGTTAWTDIVLGKPRHILVIPPGEASSLYLGEASSLYLTHFHSLQNVTEVDHRSF